jgi:hypothetical protein
VKIPIENLTAPRIRLDPEELEHRHKIIEKLQRLAEGQTRRPSPKVLNLASQGLGDPYQIEALHLMLQLNSTLEVLNLSDNELQDISKLPLQRVKKLYVAHNSFTTFENFPAVLPECELIVATENFIMNFDGLTKERFPKLKRLCVANNPISQDMDHRLEIVERLPSVQMVDLFPRQRIYLTARMKATDVLVGDDTRGCFSRFVSFLPCVRRGGSASDDENADNVAPSSKLV